jgi:lysophospholipase L1-like esterase
LDHSKDTKESLKYVSLGDSIAYGIGASSSDKSYVGRMSGYLSKKYKSFSVENLTIPGITSSQLLLQLTNPELAVSSIPKDFELRNYAIKVCKSTESAVKTADVITISIGGKNLLGGVDVAKGKIDFVAVSRDMVGFSTDWPKIIQAIRKLNPNVKILAMTVYDPFKKDDKLYAIADNLINSINLTIRTGAAKGKNSYKVVEVYKLFNEYKEGDKFGAFCAVGIKNS